MKALIGTIFLLSTSIGSVAMASDKCSVPEAEWRPQEDLQRQLEGAGWTVRRIKVDDGCYEVYGVDADGRRYENYYDPKTLTLVSAELED